MRNTSRATPRTWGPLPFRPDIPDGANAPVPLCKTILAGCGRSVTVRRTDSQIGVICLTVLRY